MILFVHGLWLTGLESVWLRRKLGVELGIETAVFRYNSITESISDVVERLHSFIAGSKAPVLHLVGHSLGSIVILRLLEKHPDVPPGRVVLLAPPLQGSCVARRVAEWKLGSMALGRMVEEELLSESRRRWNGSRPLGVIAGDLSIGLGRLIHNIPYPNDGTVAVSETRLEGATDSIVVPVSHTGMEFSSRVARETAHFLRHGRFSAPQ